MKFIKYISRSFTRKCGFKNNQVDLDPNFEIGNQNMTLSDIVKQFLGNSNVELREIINNFSCFSFEI